MLEPARHGVTGWLDDSPRGHVLRFEDGGMPVIEVTMLHTRSVLVDGQAKTLHAGQVYTLPADVALDLLSMGTAKRRILGKRPSLGRTGSP